VQPIAGAPRDGGSSWQSLARRSGVIEADQLNGEVVLLGRLHGVPTPVNELLRRLAVADARAGAPPGSHAQDDFLAMLAER
jgi:2-dehydropantoate 2-reductase